MKKSETIDAWHNGEGKYAGEKEALIEKKWRDTSFDGAQGEIISIAWAVEDDHVYSSSRYLKESECDTLDGFFYSLRESIRGRNPYFIGHYVAGFDLKFLFQRAVILGVKPPFKLPFDGRHGKDFYDNQIAWCGFKGNISQDNLCKALGMPGKGDIDGSKVWDYVNAGRIDEVVEYNKQDVEQVRAIYNRINFLS